MTLWPPDDPASSIVRYLTGELSEREEVELLRELERDPERRRIYDDLRRMWERSELPKHEWDVRTALERIKRPRPGRAVPSRVPLAWKPSMRVPMGIAATIAVLMGSVVVWRVLDRLPSSASQVSSRV